MEKVKSIFRWLISIQYEVEILEEPKLKGEHFEYKAKVLSKYLTIFNKRVYSFKDLRPPKRKYKHSLV